MIRILFRNKDGHVQPELPPAQLASALQEEASLVWIDIADEPVEVSTSILIDIFGFHPLAVEDTLHESHMPKLDDWGSHLYLVLRDVTLDQAHSYLIAAPEMDLFLGQRFLVTYQIQPGEAVDRVWQACLRDDRFLQYGADHLLYQLLNELVADYLGVVEQLEEELNLIEAQVFDDPRPTILERIFTLKRAVLQLRRITTPQLELIHKLAHEEYSVIDPKDRIFFRDVYDHVVRMQAHIENLRELISGALETYLSAINNRMNDTIKTLTIITTLFMPLAFITGFFGMNFFHPTVPLQGWTGYLAFGIALLVMVLIPYGMYRWMRSRIWT